MLKVWVVGSSPTMESVMIVWSLRQPLTLPLPTQMGPTLSPLTRGEGVFLF